ncbi:MAG: hypothetical protein WCG23_13095 [bacterium]
MKQFLLPSQKTAVFKDGKGRDLLNAQRKAKTPEEILYALIAEITEIDGETVIYEDLLEMSLEDVLTLQAEMSGKFQSLQQNASSTSPKPQDGNTAK